MPLNGTVGRFVLIVAVGRYQNGGHHGQGTESCGGHVGLHVAVIVLESPDKTALGTDHAGYGVVDQGIEIGDAGFFEGLFELFVIEPLEDGLEVAVIGLGNGILAGEPQILLLAQSVLETGSCEVLDGSVRIVDALDDAGALEVKDGLSGLGSVGGREHDLCLSGTFDLELGVLIYIAVCVTGHGNGLFPGTDIRLDALHQDGGTEYGAVQGSPDGGVGALVHLL